MLFPYFDQNRAHAFGNILLPILPHAPSLPLPPAGVEDGFPRRPFANKCLQEVVGNKSVICLIAALAEHVGVMNSLITNKN